MKPHEEYEKETGKTHWDVCDCGEMPYTDEYVEWLERKVDELKEKLNINSNRAC